MSWRKGQPPSAIAGAEGGAICDEDADVKPAVCASASRASSCDTKHGRAREAGVSGEKTRVFIRAELWRGRRRRKDPEQAGQSHEIGAPQKAIQHPPKLGGPP